MMCYLMFKCFNFIFNIIIHFHFIFSQKFYLHSLFFAENLKKFKLILILSDYSDVEIILYVRFINDYYYYNITYIYIYSK